MAAQREVFLRLVEARVAGVSVDAEVVAQARINGERRRTAAATKTEERLEGSRRELRAAWASDDAGGMAWELGAEELKRIQAHEPSTRIDLLADGRSTAFASIDLRDLELSKPSSKVVRRPLHGNGTVLGEAVLQAAWRERKTAPSPRAGRPDTVEASLDTQAGLGFALSEEHVLIGTHGVQDMTLHITLLSANTLNSVAGPLGSGVRFFLRYHIFGVPIETEAFGSLRHAKFAPIRDSFKIRSSTPEVARFLRASPVRVYLCARDGDREAGVPDVLASALMRFDTLFESGDRFTQATSKCAFALQPQAPYSIAHEDDEGLPSIAVTLELHVDGKVEKVVVDEGTMPSPRSAQVQTDPEDPGPVAPGELGPDGSARVAVIAVELDPSEQEEDGEEPGCHVAIALVVGGNGGQQVCTPANLALDDYGHLERVALRDLFLVVPTNDDRDVYIQCRTRAGAVLGHGVVQVRGAAPRQQEVILFGPGPNPARRGTATVVVEPASHVPETMTLATPRATHGFEPGAGGGGTWLKYRATVDLRSIKGLDKTYNAYLQYEYPLFGVAHTIRTRPPIRIDRYSHKIIPHGLRLFEFQTTRERLEQAAQSEPLVVEMWHQDRYTADVRLGFCALPLRRVIESRPYFRWGGQTFATLRAVEAHREKLLSQAGRRDADKPAGPEQTGAQRALARLRRQLDAPVVQVQVLETELSICSFGQDGEDEHAVKRVAQVHCAFTVETLGVVETPPPVAAERAAPPAGAEAEAKRGGQEQPDAQSRAAEDDDASAVAPPPPPPPPPPPATGRDSQDELASDWDGDGAALREAWAEFEAWRDAQTAEWEAQMKSREALRMSELEQEWAAREHERAVALRKAQEQFAELDTRMHRAIADAERRERTVARLEQDLQRASEQRTADLELLGRRAREESEHQVRMQERKAAALEEELRRVRSALAQSERRQAKADEDFATFREKVRQSPEAVLQRDIAQLQGKVAQLQEQIEQEKERTAAERLAKETLRAKVGHLSRELAKVQRNDAQRAERQLDNLRLEYLAREERYVLDGDRQQLQGLKQELNELRAATLRGTPPTRPPCSLLLDPALEEPLAATAPAGRGGEGEGEGEGLSSAPTDDAQLARLEGERRDLLDAGYSTEHPIVAQLERHIALVREQRF